MAVTWKRVSYETDEKKMLVWFVGGTIATGTEQGPRIHLDDAYTAGAVWMYSKEAPSGAAIICDINEAGATLFSTRPQINIGDNADSGSAVFSDTALADNAQITMDIDQIGSGTAGANLTVILEMTVA
jgi:hypothetical protein